MAETSRASILLIYTGGTIGMKTNPETGALSPFDFNDMYEEFPYLRMLNVDISVLHFKPIDSSNVTPALWIELARLIRDSYASFDGFVVLHGTDTMAYSASALSFMIENLGKPVVFTGSQIPIGVLRTDGRENLITAIEIAAAKEGGRAVVPEVCIYFQNKLFRANRTTKHSAELLNAFRSDNYPALADVGVNIHYNEPFIRRAKEDSAPLRIATALETGIEIVKIFPGMRPETLRGDAPHSRRSRRRAGDLRGGKRADGRLVRAGGRPCGRAGSGRTERDAMSGRQRVDGYVRDRQAPSGVRRSQRPGHYDRKRRYEADVSAGAELGRRSGPRHAGSLDPGRDHGLTAAFSGSDRRHRAKGDVAVRQHCFWLATPFYGLTGPALISFFRAFGRAAVRPRTVIPVGDAGKRLVHAFRTFLYGIPIICGGNVRFSSVRSEALSRT